MKLYQTAEHPSWKKKLQERLMQDLYDPEKSKLLAEIDNLLVEFRHFLKKDASTAIQVYFEGNSYFLPADAMGSTTILYVDLAPHFQNKLRIVRSEFDTVRNEEREMQKFFRRMLNFINNEADVASILPSSLFKVNNVFYEQSLTDDQIEKFKKENISHIQSITNRMVENLLMQ